MIQATLTKALGDVIIMIYREASMCNVTNHRVMCWNISSVFPRWLPQWDMHTFYQNIKSVHDAGTIKTEYNISQIYMNK